MNSFAVENDKVTATSKVPDFDHTTLDPSVDANASTPTVNSSKKANTLKKEQGVTNRKRAPKKEGAVKKAKVVKEEKKSGPKGTVQREKKAKKTYTKIKKGELNCLRPREHL